jgi:hypothetical protein
MQGYTKSFFSTPIAKKHIRPAGEFMAEKELIPWHEAFAGALQLELEAYRDVLQINIEYTLNDKPLRVDVVVIKKNKDTVITKNIGALFRTVNIVEFKSPSENVSIGKFVKVLGYACIYAYQHKTDLRNMTVSIVAAKKPKKLLKYLKQVYGYTVEEFDKGVYHVSGNIMPIQIIETKKLSKADNLWLRNLRNDLTVENMQDVFYAGERHADEPNMRAYMHAVTTANTAKMKEVIDMSKERMTVDQVLEETGVAARIMARRGPEFEARGARKTKFEVARNFKADGFPLEVIAKNTGLSFDDIAAL